MKFTVAGALPGKFVQGTSISKFWSRCFSVGFHSDGARTEGFFHHPLKKAALIKNRSAFLLSVGKRVSIKTAEGCIAESGSYCVSFLFLFTTFCELAWLGCLGTSVSSAASAALKASLLSMTPSV